MTTYFNFTQTDQSIAYEPYLYDKGNSYAHLISGIVLLIAGTILSLSKTWKEGIYFGILFGGILILNGLYRLLIEGKTKLIFSKTDDVLYRITPLGKQKKIALSNIYDIITVSENYSFVYAITNKLKANSKSIDITTFIDKKRQQKPEFIFLEEVILLKLQQFLSEEKRII